MGAEYARLGPVMWLAQVIMLLLTAGVLWLNVVGWDTLAPAFIVFGLGGLLLITAAGAFTGNLRGGGFGAKAVAVTVIGLILLSLVNLGLYFMFDVPFAVSSAATWHERVMVNVLFAIYEENLMFGVYAAGKAAGLPDIPIIAVSMLVFVPLHSWVMTGSLVFTLFTALGRAVMSSQYAASDHSDPSYLTHIIWNLIVS